MKNSGKFVRWVRSPHGQTTGAAFMWWMTAANILWCVERLHQRYDEISQIQAIRIACEARGGFYGATDGTEARCLER